MMEHKKDNSIKKFFIIIGIGAFFGLAYGGIGGAIQLGLASMSIATVYLIIENYMDNH